MILAGNRPADYEAIKKYTTEEYLLHLEQWITENEKPESQQVEED